MGLKAWWSRVWRNTEWISLVATLVTTLVLLAFTKWASLIVGDLHSVIEKGALDFMANDRDLVWGICSKPFLNSEMGGHILSWNFSMVCDDAPTDYNRPFIVNPRSTFAFLNSLTQNTSRRCYDLMTEVQHPTEGERDCAAFFEDIRTHGNWQSVKHMPIQDVHAHGSQHLKDVISIPLDDVTGDGANQTIIFRMASANSSVVMHVNNSDWITRDGNADELIRKHQQAVCNKTILDRKVPPYWVGRYTCEAGVDRTYQDIFSTAILGLKERDTVRPIESLGIIGRFDDWYAIYTGMLAGFFASCATLLALVLIAVMQATFNLGASLAAAEEAKWKAREQEKDKKIEAMSQKLEDLCTSLIGTDRASAVGVNGQKGHAE
jgi:hypothetical protein